jgi:hypothetical protein
VFSVDSGTKGSRVSVIEGEVHVTPEEAGRNAGSEVVLHPGDQTSTDPSMERTSISSEVAWSQNAALHVRMLGELLQMQKEMDKIQQPGMRYSSRILGRLPQSTVFYMAIPNIGQQLGQAQEVMNNRVKESPALQQWWNQQGKANETFNKVIDSLRQFGDYVGDEVVITAAVAPNANGKWGIQAPVLLAELKRSGFKEFAESEVKKISGGEKSHLQFVENAAAVASDSSNDLLVSVSDNMLMITPDAHAMRVFAPSMKAENMRAMGSGGGAATFINRLEQAYQEGVGFLFAADLGTMSATIASSSDGASNGIAPLGNVNYLVMEQRDSGTSTETRAVLTFSGKRQGIFGWLGRPAPMAALEYVTANATAVSGFTINSPGQVIDDILSWTTQHDPNGQQDLAKVEQELGFSIKNDLAAALGSEFVMAFDGPLVPIPSWKIVTEVYDAGKLQWVITKMVDDANSKIAKNGGQPLQPSQVTQGNLTYYRIVIPDAKPFGEIDYVFTGGYLIAAPSRSLLDQAISAHQDGTSLPHSAAFRAALPHDRQANFSALAYQNFGSALGTLMNTFSPAQRAKIQATAGLDSAPSLIGAYGEEDRIVVSTQGLASLGSATLMKLAGPFSAFAMNDSGEHAGGTKRR